MDKNTIKKFAIWARRDLIERVTQRAMKYGIVAHEPVDPNADSANGYLFSPVEKRQRQTLILKIQEKGFEQVIEEVAYTWFNRFAALRFMEVNDYLPTHIRVFTNEAGEFKPQILSEAIHLDIQGLDLKKVYELESANKKDELYKYLLIVQCNALYSILPRMFQKIEDYTELLLPDNLLRDGNVLEQMVTAISEDDWKDQVQIIGWLYQYYIAEPKDKLINAHKQYNSEDISYVTQLFTSDWIVRYMVENSLGRLWLEGHPNDALKSNWKYYLEEAEQEADVQAQLDIIRKEYAKLKPEEIRLIDPCMGSGHILCVFFDVLVQIYTDYGYSEKEAVASIIEKNLFGLDIDERATQLAYFAVMMKARQYDRRFFSRNIQPHVYAICESNNIRQEVIDYFCSPKVSQGEALAISIKRLLDQTKDATEYGSLITISDIDFDLLCQRIEEIKNDDSFYRLDVINQLLPLIEVAQVLAQKYHVVVTNPPYMNSKYMPKELKVFVQKNFTDFKNDLFAAFIKQTLKMTVKNGHIGLLMPYVWMYISSYKEVRDYINNNATISTLVQLEYNAFEAACVPVAALTLCKNNTHFSGEYIKLSDFKGSENQGPKTLEAVKDRNCGFRYTSNQDGFSKLPGSPVAYWVTYKLIEAFSCKKIEDYATVTNGLFTCDNNRFLRLWHEIKYSNFFIDCVSKDENIRDMRRWYPYNKGGNYRKWYGNHEYVVDFKAFGKDISSYRVQSGQSASFPGQDFYFKPSLSWSFITSSKFGIRFYPKGFVFDIAGSSVFLKNNKYLYQLLAFLGSEVVVYILQIINPTMNYQAGNVRQLPVFERIFNNEEVGRIAQENISLSKSDWDSFETSWDFVRHPLVKLKIENGKLKDGVICVGRDGCDCCVQHSYNSIKTAYEDWSQICTERFNQLKSNEEELNRIFIDIYGLNDELTPEVEDKDVTVRKADLQREIRSFISYAVGCMMGRYSLDCDGLAFAGGEWDKSKYNSFMPDEDGIIPITDDEYFNDDIVGRFIDFVKVVYGEDTLEDNLKFIADAIGGKGSARQVIRNYFISEFFADHVKVYQKRPIYWLFDSGKKNGFKCLIYMHRYQQDTLARIRTDYVHEQQARYRTVIADLEQRINGASTSERVKLNKQLAKIKDQAEEIRLYEEKIHHLADQMIKIDLDDGVKHNYAIFESVLAKIK